MGFGGNSLRWISEFLCGRTQYVRVQNEASSPQNVVSGIPQGTVLGPLMFLLYVNDMGDVLKHLDLVLYADDSKIFKSVVNDNDFNDMTSDISNFEKWVSDWQLKVNSEKCELLPIGNNNKKFQYELNGSAIAASSKCRDLGVTISSDLKFTAHCQKIARNTHYRRRHVELSSRVTASSGLLTTSQI